MFHPILAHLKAESATIGIGAGILGGIGLLANPVTSPKVCAVMVLVSDWSAVWTFGWWLRMIIGLAFGVGLWLMQRRKNGKQLLAREVVWKTQMNDLRDELRHNEVMLTAAELRVAVLERRRK